MDALERLRIKAREMQARRAPQQAVRASAGAPHTAPVRSVEQPATATTPERIEAYLKAHELDVQDVIRLEPIVPLRIEEPLPEARRAKLMKALKIQDVRLALLCVPSGFIDGTRAVARTRDFPEGLRTTFVVRTSGHMRVFDRNNQEVPLGYFQTWLDAPWQGYWSRFRRATIEAYDEEGERIMLGTFSPRDARRLLAPGTHLLQGQIETYRNRYLAKITPLPDAAIGRVYVSYATPGSTTSDEGVRALVLEALGIPDATDACIDYLREQTLMDKEALLDVVRSIDGCSDLESMHDFLRRLHAPANAEQAKALRMAARRLAVVGLVHAARCQSWREPHPKAPIDIDLRLIEQLKKQLPVALTREQSSAVVTICEALRSTTPLNGLLTGDVGSGKTFVFSLPAVAAHLSGARVAIIAPTEILADQLSHKLQSSFPQARIERVYASAKKIDPDAILVGTIGLGNVANKLGYTPDFLVVDEQHKMAVTARRAMAAEHTHVLEASATPIPHALASTIFAGTTMITLRRCPVERDIVSTVGGPHLRSEISRQIKQALAEGARAAIIYPRVANTTEGASVERAACDLRAFFGEDKVATLHGKMSDEDIRRELQAFRDGSKPLLVASTIVETGIDVPDIRVLVVRQADRFGIAQLHQLRGRLARNGGQGHFYMWVDPPTDGHLDPLTTRRLNAVAAINDGFALAEEDMRQRGFGDLLGEQQNGNITVPMRLLNLEVHEIEEEVEAWEAHEQQRVDEEAETPA
ncbi:MAG: helicase-related protein [Rhodocyclaceae bacterium]|nr:helicase-related protein [Rhodocyclaceae bacterium]